MTTPTDQELEKVAKTAMDKVYSVFRGVWTAEFVKDAEAIILSALKQVQPQPPDYLRSIELQRRQVSDALSATPQKDLVDSIAVSPQERVSADAQNGEPTNETREDCGDCPYCALVHDPKKTKCSAIHCPFCGNPPVTISSNDPPSAPHMARCGDCNTGWIPFYDWNYDWNRRVPPASTPANPPKEQGESVRLGDLAEGDFFELPTGEHTHVTDEEGFGITATRGVVIRHGCETEAGASAIYSTRVSYHCSPTRAALGYEDPRRFVIQDANPAANPPKEGRASAESERGKQLGYNCPVCSEPIDDSQPTEHTNSGLTHASCSVLNIDTQRLDWLEERATQLDWDYDADASEPGRTVDEITGNVNDREWDEVGRGHNLREAIDKAMASNNPPIDE